MGVVQIPLDHDRVVDSIHRLFHILNKIDRRHGEQYTVNALVNGLIQYAFCQPNPEASIRAIHVSIDALARFRKEKQG